MLKEGFPFHPVIRMPGGATLFDFSRGYLDPTEVERAGFGIGRYGERRPGIYTSDAYQPGTSRAREYHIGIDLFAPQGTEIHAFMDGQIHLFGNNSAHLDYGYTLVTEHDLQGAKLYALHGHLSRRSIDGKAPGQRIKRGEVIAWVGPQDENGGWVPHLHFQLSFERPEKPDLPGVVSAADLPIALLKYPDPRLVLGPLYGDVG